MRTLSGHGESRPNAAAAIVSQIEPTAKPPIWPDVRQEPPEVGKHQTSTESDGIALITQWPRVLRCPA